MRSYRWLFVVAALVGISFFVFRGDDIEEVSGSTIALARQAAIHGLNETAKMLVADTTSWANNPDKYAFLNASLEGARYSTEVATPYGTAPSNNGCAADTVDVVSTAELANRDSHRITATYVRTCEDRGVRLIDFAER